MLVAQPRRLHSHSSKHAVDSTDAPQQVAYPESPDHNGVAAIIYSFIRLDTQQRGLGPDVDGSTILAKVDAVRRD